MRNWLPALVVASLAMAACPADRTGDVVERDTIVIDPDTLMIERTAIEDTIRDPNRDRDTLP
jgi:uncharacterized protein YcfL